nr:hypothetical protein OG781_40645 [Streptomyces sp. NBC_00830]
MGLFDKLTGTRHPAGGVAPRSAEEARIALLAINGPDVPYLLTTYTNALVTALRSGLATLVEDEELRDRVDITTVDALAGRVVSTSRRPLRGGEEETRWEQAARATGALPVLAERAVGRRAPGTG